MIINEDITNNLVGNRSVFRLLYVADYPILSILPLSYPSFRLSLSTDLFSIWDGGHSKIWGIQRRLVDDSAYFALSSLGWAWA